MKDILKAVVLAGVTQLLLTGAFVAVFNFSVLAASLIALIPTLLILAVILRALDVF